MRIVQMAFILVTLAGPACTRVEPAARTETRQGAGDAMLSEAQALEIARADAVKAYNNLPELQVRTELRDAKWHVAYSPKLGVRGGGPSYVIDARTGAILEKTYQQ